MSRWSVPRRGDRGVDPGAVSRARLRRGYRQCGRLTWQYGTTYFWGAALLPRRQRKHVYAVYALCRLADDIVDLPPPSSAAGTTDGPDVGTRLQAFADFFADSLAAGDSTDTVMAAVVHTVRECKINPECFDRFFGAMAMDLSTSSYQTWDDLCGYMEGSAAVIGEMMLPVLEPLSPAAYDPARTLGLAFQLTNFLRDIDEDLDRARVYMPTEDLERFGVDLTTRTASPEFKRFLAFEIARNRELYTCADTGIALLPPRSARCVGAARVLYARILDRIEAADYDVFTARVRVPLWRKAQVAVKIMVVGPPATMASIERKKSSVPADPR